MILMLWLVSGTYVTVRPCGEGDVDETFRNHANAITGKRDFRLFRHIGTGGADLGPIAVDMEKVAFISPVGTE